MPTDVNLLNDILAGFLRYELYFEIVKRSFTC